MVRYRLVRLLTPLVILILLPWVAPEATLWLFRRWEAAASLGFSGVEPCLHDVPYRYDPRRNSPNRWILSELPEDAVVQHLAGPAQSGSAPSKFEATKVDVYLQPGGRGNGLAYVSVSTQNSDGSQDARVFKLYGVGKFPVDMESLL